MDTPLIEAIRDVWRQDRGNYETKINEFRISSVAYCSRKLYYDKTTPKDERFEYTNKTLGIFAIGTAIHEYIQSYLTNNNLLLLSEGEVTFANQDISLIGHYDLLINDPQLGLKVCDIKTCNSKAFNYRQTEASSHHKTQANTYASILNVNFYSILYVEIETFAMVEHEYQTDKGLFNDVLTKLSLVYEHIQKQTLPDKITTSWECNYCPYRKKCLEE